MARPDVKKLRRQQIIDAFEICVSRFGVEGATLKKTAEQAGLARALIRHNVGNREDLIAALTNQFLTQSRNSMKILVDALPAHNKTAGLIELLFDPSLSDPKLIRVANALITASSEDLNLAAQMREWLDDFVTAVEEIISQEHPQATPNRVSAVAAGITGIYFNVEALYPIGNIEALLEASKHAAALLAASLGEIHDQ